MIRARRVGWRLLGGALVALLSSVVFAQGVAATGIVTPFEDSIAQRMQACAGCHGDKGAGIAGSAFPRLAGQPAAYLSAQMRAFRDGVRHYAPMNFLMSRQSDAYFAEIAEYFAVQKPEPQGIDVRRAAPIEPRVLAAGKSLMVEGRPGAGLPACTACHGEDLSGTLPAIPALAGLPRDFLIEQLGSWKTGSHRSPEPNCMARVASLMSGPDIVAAASWLSQQQPVGVPASAPEKLPIACGRY